MTDRYKPLLDRDFLRAELDREYLNYRVDHDEALLQRLTNWHANTVRRETQAEAAFTRAFFVETWDYREAGRGGPFELLPKFIISGAGANGQQGEADLVVGLFGEGRPAIPQIVCEYKGTGTDLDRPQARKGNTRSPVQQAADYLRCAARGVFPGAPVQPRWALVTDMNAFRLYWGSGDPDRYLRFNIAPGDLFPGINLLGAGEAARFDRFLFWRLFRADMLLADGGRPRLERLIEKQGSVSKKLEGRFYGDYRRYRELLIDHVSSHPPAGVTPGGAIRLAQRLLDRLIFIMFAEDMGGRVGFPAGELTAQLKRFAEDNFLEDDRFEVWDRIQQIFQRMDEGGRLGAEHIHRFNGGLFRTDAQLDALRLPNHLFVRRGQSQNDASAAAHKASLYWLAAEYNYAAEGDADNAIGLYTLGHIFEQSIVELEALEARAEGRETLATVTERKRDGVYYTPEWVVRRIVEEVLDPLFARWRAEADGDPAAYWTRLRRIRVVDPGLRLGRVSHHGASAPPRRVRTRGRRSLRGRGNPCRPD